jgi:hypothetical protein
MYLPENGERNREQPSSSSKGPASSHARRKTLGLPPPSSFTTSPSHLDGKTVPALAEIETAVAAVASLYHHAPNKGLGDASHHRMILRHPMKGTPQWQQGLHSQGGWLGFLAQPGRDTAFAYTQQGGVLTKASWAGLFVEVCAVAALAAAWAMRARQQGGVSHRLEKGEGETEQEGQRTGQGKQLQLGNPCLSGPDSFEPLCSSNRTHLLSPPHAHLHSSAPPPPSTFPPLSAASPTKTLHKLRTQSHPNPPRNPPTISQHRSDSNDARPTQNDEQLSSPFASLSPRPLAAHPQNKRTQSTPAGSYPSTHPCPFLPDLPQPQSCPHHTCSLSTRASVPLPQPILHTSSSANQHFLTAPSSPLLSPTSPFLTSPLQKSEQQWGECIGVDVIATISVPQLQADFQRLRLGRVRVKLDDQKCDDDSRFAARS